MRTANIEAIESSCTFKKRECYRASVHRNLARSGDQESRTSLGIPVGQPRSTRYLSHVQVAYVRFAGALLPDNRRKKTVRSLQFETPCYDSHCQPFNTRSKTSKAARERCSLAVAMASGTSVNTSKTATTTIGSQRQPAIACHPTACSRWSCSRTPSGR